MGVDLDELTKQWQDRWSDDLFASPYSFDIDRWVRFHSLPESKRYPEGETEHKIVLDRHYRVLNDLKPGKELYVLTSEWSDRPDQPHSSSFDQDAIFWRSIFENPTDKTYRLLFVSTKAWQQGQLDKLLRAVTNDETAGVFFTPKDLSWVYHPYDGGMDILLPSSAERDELKKKHLDWVSQETSQL